MTTTGTTPSGTRPPTRRSPRTLLWVGFVLSLAGNAATSALLPAPWVSIALGVVAVVLGVLLLRPHVGRRSGRDLGGK